MEAVIAGRAAAGFFVPEVEAVLQRFALVRAGKVDDHGRAAAQRRTAAGIEIDIKVKMRVCIDKAGEEQLARNVDDLGIRAGQSRCNGDDFLALDENVCVLTAGGVDDGAAAENFFHTRQLLF